MVIADMAPITTDAAERAAIIRTLNDVFRRGFIGGRVVVTAGVDSLGAMERLDLMRAVQQFDVFSRGNDPYGEHDFGSLEVNGNRFMWKIDYCDRELEFGSPDPCDPAVTTRVLTIMRADEY